MITVEAKQDIPIGHKVALMDRVPGDTAIKYGIDMGRVVAAAKLGEHAHVHNIKTKRWRDHKELTCPPSPKTPLFSATGVKTAASACATTS